MIKILIADDHAPFRRALRLLLDAEADIEVIAEAPDGELAVELAGRYKPDFVVMDASMPKANGIDATREITTAWPSCRVIGISIYVDNRLTEAMTAAGAISVISKAGTATDVIDLVRRLAEPR